MAFTEVSRHADRPGRARDGLAVGRHQLEAPTSRRESELDVAARAIGQALRSGANAGAFDRLVIAATPTLIGAIRSHLPDAVRAVDIIEIRHRLLDLSKKELAQRLDKEGVVGRVAS